MKATIEIKEIRGPDQKAPGLFGSFKSPIPGTMQMYVIAQIELSEQERFILTKNEMWDQVIYTRKIPEHRRAINRSLPKELDALSGRAREIALESLADITHDQITVRSLVEDGNFKWLCEDGIIEAKEMARALEKDVLPGLKAIIDAARDSGPKRTIQL